MKNDNDLFYTCSLIEYIGRKCCLKRKDVVECLGRNVLRRIYKYAGTLHCEPIEAVANEYIEMNEIVSGTFDNIKKCKYEIPDYWTIGEVYARLIEDIDKENTFSNVIRINK